MQSNVPWLWGVWGVFCLCFALFCPSSTGERLPHKHATQGNQRGGDRLHQGTHSPKRYCWHQTAGAITQRCGPGFYREWAGPHRGQCVACSCNGLSNECDGHTGNCMNCQSNTDGDRCERCKEGYYGNAAQKTCRACPCPSTWNNFALACLDISSGEVECFCKQGYYGARCDRCASGYYGNPMIYGGSCQPCDCSDGTSNICDSLTGKCITSGKNSASGEHCHECDSCTNALLVDLETMDDELSSQKQQLQNISQGTVSLTVFNKLEAAIAETKILVGRYLTAVNGLHPTVVQLEEDVDIVRDDLSHLIDKIDNSLSDADKVLENVNETKLKAGDLVSEVQAIIMTIQNLIKQLSEVKPVVSITVPAKEVARMLKEAQHMVQEMRGRGCTAQRHQAGREQKEAHKLLDLIRTVSVPLDTNQALANQTAVSMMTSDTSLRDLADALSDAVVNVDRSHGLNLNSEKTLQDLLELRAKLKRESDMITPMIDMTKDQLRNTTGLFGIVKESKAEYEHLAAQIDGANLELTKKLNNITQGVAGVDMIGKAEEHAEELDRLAREFQLVVQNATYSSPGLLNAVVGKGAHNSIINTIKEAEMAANQSKVGADLAFKDVEQGELVNRAERLKDNASNLLTESMETHSSLNATTDRIDSHKKRVAQTKEKGELLRKNFRAVKDDLKKIERDDIGVLLDLAKTAASAANDTVSNVTDRLRNINQEVDKIRPPNVSQNIDDILSDADKALKRLDKTLPELKDTLAQIEDLGNQESSSGNMTESIRRIMDVIQETRNFVNRLSVATTFNGRTHIELHPPSNIEDVRAFTAVDLLLNRHQKNPFKADRRRRRRQDKQKDTNLFVFYLGNKDSSGDYIGMAVRNNVLVCLYKLGGVVHEVEANQITTTTNVNSTIFDRVVFQRIYQDAEVNFTQNFTSPKPISLAAKKSLPDTTIGVLNLDAESVVFYVGGHPDDFTPPVELQYPMYRGAIKLTSVNDEHVCLFNYKHAVNIDEKQPFLKVPQPEMSDYFEGTGYRMALTSDPHKTERLFKFSTKSRQTNGLLFYIGNEDSYICVFMERGHLVVQGRQASHILKARSRDKVSLFDKKIIISMDDKFYVQYGANSEQISTDYIKTSYRNYYIGGLPAQLRERHNITIPPLRGCVDHLRADNEYVQFNKTIGVGVGCPESASLLGVREATFDSGGSLSVNSLGLQDKLPFMVSLGFKTTEQHGALLRTSYQDLTSTHDFQLSLVDGYVVFNYDNHALKSHKIYNDGRWHYLSAKKKHTGLELRVDNVDVGQEQQHSIKPRTLEFVLGGETFRGCIVNVFTSRPDMKFIPTDLSSSTQKGDVVLGRCHLDHHSEAMPWSIPLSALCDMGDQTSTTNQCRPPPTHPGEYQFSGPHSWLSYNVPTQDLNYRPHFSLEVRTRSSEGLLFHVAGEGDISLVSLFIANGKIKLSLGQTRVIHHKKKSNDGNWHRVVFSVERDTFHLLVDGFRVTDGVLFNSEGSSLALQNPVYLGSDPTDKTSKSHWIPRKSVIGCIRGFRLNEEVIEEPVATHGVSPCFDGFSEAGTFFGGDGGYVVLDKFFSLDSNFELAFELRPRDLTGLLFYVRGHKTSLNVFLGENKVNVQVHDGKHVFGVGVTHHQSLCDGQFHVVAVSKQNNVIKLEVDFVSEQTVGPSQSTSYSPMLESLYIGGIPGTLKQKRVPVSSSFVGCLRNMRVNGRPVAFEEGSSVVGPVNINECPAD